LKDLPFLRDLFSRKEFVLIKSAILVFVTAKYEENKNGKNKILNQ
jgi:hypothetical protein